MSIVCQRCHAVRSGTGAVILCERCGEETLLLIQGTANMLRGMTLDPAISAHSKEAMQDTIRVLEDLLENLEGLR